MFDLCTTRYKLQFFVKHVVILYYADPNFMSLGSNLKGVTYSGVLNARGGLNNWGVGKV